MQNIIGIVNGILIGGNPSGGGGGIPIGAFSSAFSSAFNLDYIPPLDTDAQAFIDAAAITGTTQQNALNQLVLDLKGTGSTTNNTDVWSNISAFYPFCPIDNTTATAAAYKWNLKDPRDLDAAYRLTFVNNPLYDVSLGLNQNASNNAYSDSHLIPLNDLPTDSNGVTISFSRFSSANSVGYALAARNNATFDSNGIQAPYLSKDGISDGVVISDNGSFNMNVYTTSRLNSTDFSFYESGVSIGTSANASSFTPDFSYYLMAMNVRGGVSGLIDDVGFNSASIHSGLSVNQAQDIYDAITTYNTALGR